MDKRIEELLSQMTREEKVAMTAGSDMWHTTGVPRLGIPPFKVSDGPNGARGDQMGGGKSSACFPCGTALGATWNTALIEEVGRALGQELRTKGAQLLLAPTVNIHRSPLAGRNFECYSEDPHLTGRIAVAFIRGVQSQGVGTAIKHFVCNDSEFERNSISSEVDERALREIYLVPFEDAVRDAKPWALMSAYNKIDGVYASQNHRLLTEILKQEWGFTGFVISDWFGSSDSVGCANGGLDLEMPGPARFLGDKLLEGLKTGEIDEATIDDKVRRLLRVVIESGALARAEADEAEPAEEAIDRPEHREIARRAAGESIVLLKNEGSVLPFDAARISTLAVIGPNADQAVMQGGGSAQVSAHYATKPLDAIRELCGDAVEVRYAVGCTSHKLLPDLDMESLTPLTPSKSGRNTGLTVEYWNGAEPAGEPVVTRTSSQSQLTWFGDPPKGVDGRNFCVRLCAAFTPSESGLHSFGISSVGLSRLLINGDIVVDNWEDQTRGGSFFGMGTDEVIGRVELEAGRAVDLEIHVRPENPGISGIKIGCLGPVPEEAIAEAEALASSCDAALLVVGLNRDWESEGHDRRNLELAGRQNELIERVLAANPNTAIVLNCGAPIEMPWIDQAKAVLQVWYGGQEAGNAIADVVFGARNPSGKLPTTFPKRIEDTPAYLHYPGENGAVRYGESIFVGYRYYDTRKVEPLFPFGHGQSYTEFEYGAIELSTSSAPAGGEIALEVSLTIDNLGAKAGAEVVQLYVRPLTPRLARPDKELRAFAKVELAAGEKNRVRFSLGERAFACYDPAKPGWSLDPGSYEILIGSSSADIRARADFQLKSD